MQLSWTAEDIGSHLASYTVAIGSESWDAANGSSLVVSLETGDGLAEGTFVDASVTATDGAGLNHSLTLSCEVRRLPPSVVLVELAGAAVFVKEGVYAVDAQAHPVPSVCWAIEEGSTVRVPLNAPRPP